jgi:hypothetical protein
MDRYRGRVCSQPGARLSPSFPMHVAAGPPKVVMQGQQYKISGYRTDTWSSNSIEFIVALGLLHSHDAS